ncbi:(2Fe-2S)-binding protein [Mycolicibacter terrae]|jgi:bacterioferritin-associated ferredoxin|uniref:Bacterioferritin-associated ferredoxin n=1 Tax=Mycolicibacter terrae TaxID=1788 RepID=A0AAD1MGQ9_9MYCO|nr:(2Fe-2S)-binding protein [Mycolicibacter terrae]ORW90841.1 (2Fe-2S)-binding protein [Mycolicibacter terrae]BBX21239.1 (2Fe-2S)-binding protein [Mycolicibacter terrae]SNV90851.1 Putative ferredoxin [Mycolicibacter terrae]
MYVCLCAGVTSQQVIDAVKDGASTTRQVGERTGAGTVCGRCKSNIRALIAATLQQSARR